MVNYSVSVNHKPLDLSFQCGQVWQMGDSRVKIATVGKHLVHYKRWRGSLKRVPVSLTTKQELSKFLLDHDASLEPGPTSN